MSQVVRRRRYSVPMSRVKAPLAKRGAGRPLAAELEAHKEAILAAASEVLLEQGFAKTSTAEIARRAGASKKTLYTLYPSKAALYAALMQQRVVNVLRPITTDELRYEAPAKEMLNTYGNQVVRLVNSDEGRKLYRMVIAEGIDFPELGSAYWTSGPDRGRLLLKT